MGSLVISREATADMREIWSYIAQDDPGAADRWIDTITGTFPALASQPFMGRSRPDIDPQYRSFPVGNYLIFYAPIPGGIEIARVLHGARNLPRLFGS